MAIRAKEGIVLDQNGKTIYSPQEANGPRTTVRIWRGGGILGSALFLGFLFLIPVLLTAGLAVFLVATLVLVLARFVLRVFFGGVRRS